MVTVELNVTRKELHAGETRCSTRCPIALAALKAGLTFPNADYKGLTFALKGDKIVTDDTIMTTVKLPKSALVFMNEFDVCNFVKPLKFTVRIRNKIAAHQNIKKRYIVQ